MENTNNTTFLCPNCHKQIPVINRVVHSLRCHPSNASEAIIPIAVPVHDEDHTMVTPPNNEDWSEVTIPQPSCPSSSLTRDDEWTCSRCTYINHVDHSSCEMCGEALSHEIPPAATTVVHPHEVVQPAGACAADNTNSSYWSCPVCTFHNDRQQRECAMCGSTGLPLPSYHDQLISDNHHDDDDGMESDVIFMGRSNVNESNPTGGRSSSITRNRPSNPILDSALLGAGIGAGLALLTNRSVLGGAVQGAGVGALGGLVVHSMDAGRRRPQMRINGPFSLGQPLMRNGMMLEELLQAIQSELESSNRGRGQTNRALDPSIIDHLPVRTFQPPTPSSSSSSSNSRGEVASSCSICLGPFEAGDQIKTLPCLHLYHNRWPREAMENELVRGLSR
eukprot:scaffold3130_cov188-Ochromonas_danica.AAC.2